MVELTQELAHAKALLEAAGLSVAEKVVAVEAQPKGLCLALRTWNKAKCAAVMTVASTWNVATWCARILKGFRTLLFFGVMGASALLAQVQEMDIAGILSRWTGYNVVSEDVYLFMAVAGFGLRLITDSSTFARWKQAAAGGDGVAPGVGSGAVDEPAVGQP